MFFKRQLATVVMIVMGVISLSGYFINLQELRSFTDKDATNFYMIIAGFAAFLGCFNLLQLHLKKITYQKENWQYSIFTLLGFLVMIYFAFIDKGINNDPFIDINNNGKWDDAEECIDDNLNGICETGEPFIDKVYYNGIYDLGEEFTDALNGVYDIGEEFIDIPRGNGIYDLGEEFIDTLNGVYDLGENFVDENLNCLYDFGEEFTDSLNGIYDVNEIFIDALVFNGIYDLGEEFTDALNGVYDIGEEFVDIPKGNGVYDLGEEFTDVLNGVYDLGEEFIDTQKGNGKYDIGEDFIDSNLNCIYDCGENFTDNLKFNGVYDYGEPFVDSKNGIYDKPEKFVDENNNGKWDNAEPFDDIYGNFEYDCVEEFKDVNGDGFWNKPESFKDLPDGTYTYVKWGAHLKNKNSMFYWFYDKFYLPLGATMFALLAFFVASASYRAFRIRNFEATLLLIAGVLLMLGRVPIGAIIPWWLVLIIYISIIFSLLAHKINNKRLFFILYLSSFFISIIIGILLSWHQSTPSFLSIPIIQEWIMSVPATAGSRAIMIGIALGIIAQSFRIITGRERSILGD